MEAQWGGAGIGEAGFGIREGEDQGSAVPNPQSPIPNPGVTHKSVSPVSLVVTAFAAVPDVRGQLTPLLSRDADTEIWLRSEEHTSELQSLMRISYAVFCLKKKNKQ